MPDDNSKADPMEIEAVREKLNAGLALQYRSALHYTLVSGSVLGLEHQGFADKLWPFAQAELADARLLVEKITALEGDPTVDVAPMKWCEDTGDAVAGLIATEDEAIAALHEVIPYTGQEPRSEALEHLMEHLIMRKQNQVDFLRRAMRGR